LISSEEGLEDIPTLQEDFWGKIREFSKILKEDNGENKKILTREGARLESSLNKVWKGNYFGMIEAKKKIESLSAKYNEGQTVASQGILTVYKNIITKIQENEPEPTHGEQNIPYLSELKKVNQELFFKISKLGNNDIDDLCDSIRDLCKQASNLEKLPEVISSEENALESYFQIRDNIKKIKSEFLIKKSNLKDWLRSFHGFLEKNDKKILGIVLHLHSFYDVCHFCGPSLTRECEREGGIAAKLKSLCQHFNPDDSLPFFQVLFSCSEVRDHPEEGSRKNKYKDQFPSLRDYLIQIDPVIRLHFNNMQVYCFLRSLFREPTFTKEAFQEIFMNFFFIYRQINKNPVYFQSRLIS
jgi:hypothetical protein